MRGLRVRGPLRRFSERLLRLFVRTGMTNWQVREGCTPEVLALIVDDEFREAAEFLCVRLDGSTSVIAAVLARQRGRLLFLCGQIFPASLSQNVENLFLVLKFVLVVFGRSLCPQMASGSF